MRFHKRFCFTLGMILMAGSILTACSLGKTELLTPLDGPGMVNQRALEKVYYSYGGGEYDDSYIIDYDASERTITVFQCEGVGMEEKEAVYPVDLTHYHAIENMIADSGMRQWTDLKELEIEVLDAPRTYVNIVFYDGEELSFDSDLLLPEGGWHAVAELVSLMEECMEEK